MHGVRDDDEIVREEDLEYSKIDVTSIQEKPTATHWFDSDANIINHDSSDFPKAVLIIVTVRLGLTGIEPDYYEAVK